MFVLGSTTDIAVDKKDLRIGTRHSSGAEDQHVNGIKNEEYRQKSINQSEPNIHFIY